MFAEEEYLRNKFGIVYEEWANKTPAFIPRIKGWKKENLPFSIKTVLRREYSGFYGIVIMFTILEVVGDLFVEGKLEVDLMWGIILGVGTVVYLVLMTLKKKTKLLYEEGR